MAESSSNGESLRYVRNRAWWSPAFCALPLLIPYRHSNPSLWRWLVAGAVDVAILLVFYELNHATLMFSPREIAQRRGPFRTSVDLDALESVRVGTTSRQNAVLDPQTGERRSVIRWNFKAPDDWGGKPPVTSIFMRDQHGNQLTLNALRTDVERWGVYLLQAIKKQPEVELGPRVSEALESFTR